MRLVKIVFLNIHIINKIVNLKVAYSPSYNGGLCHLAFRDFLIPKILFFYSLIILTVPCFDFLCVL